MSFSFRNIFSPDEGGLEGSASGIPLSGQNGADRNGSGGFGASQGGSSFSYQAFLASELLAFIPPAISARSGIPMEKEVHVPFSAESSRDVRLSTLYQLCPELFAAEITPLNDSIVTLPPRLGLSSPPSHAVGVDQAASRPSPLVAADRASIANGGTPAEKNPFWSPVSSIEPKAEFGKPTAMRDDPPMPSGATPKPWPTPPKGPENNPFSVLGAGAGKPADGSQSMPSKAPDGAKIAGGFDAPPAYGGGGSESGGFAGGFQAFESSLPATNFGDSGSDALRRPVEEKGMGFSDNPFESKHGFTTLFSKGADADSGIPFPSAPVSDEKVDESQGVWGSMFHGGAATTTGAKSEREELSAEPAVFEGFGSMISKASEIQESLPWGNFSAPFAGDSPFEAVPEPQNPATQPSAGPAFGKGKGLEVDGFEPSSVAVQPEVPPATKKPVPEVSWTIQPTTGKQAPAPRSETPGHSLAANGDGTPANEVSGFSSLRSQIEESAPRLTHEVSAAAPFALKQSVEIAPASGLPAAPRDQTTGLRDLELKAIFSTSESFTLSKVARCIVGLPGISSCALSTPGKLVQASRSEESRIGNEAREMVTTLRNLAKLTGLTEAKTFTLHTDRGIVSLFLEDECCVTVHHESAAFPPGVREKLILAARSLINLEE